MEQGYGELRVTELPDLDAKRRWKLLAPLSYVTEAGDEIVAPVDLLTDFGSIPAPLRWLVSRTGRHTKAAVIHDYQWREADEGNLDRREADEIFREGLCFLGVSWLRRWMMWTAVRQAALFRPPRGTFPLIDVVRVLAITILLAPIVIPVTSIVVLGRLLIWLIDVPAALVNSKVPPKDEAL